MSDRIRIEDSHFYLDEFACGRNHPPELPDGCPYCHGSVVLHPWTFRPLEASRSEFVGERNVPYSIRSGHRCLDYNRDIWALLMFKKVYADCELREQFDVQQHDGSRHLIDAVDVRPLTGNPELKEEAYASLEKHFSSLGYTYRRKDGAGDFFHGDTRAVTGDLLGI